MSAALYLLVDCFLRGKGLNLNFRSKTREEGLEALSEIWTEIGKEAEARPYRYEKLYASLARSQAAVEMEWLIDGHSKWSEDDEDSDDSSIEVRH